MTRRGSSGPPHPPNKHSSNKRSSATAPKDWRGEDPNLELEKSRYADPIASRELLLKHLADAPEPLSAARLAKRLGLNTDAQRDALAKRLTAMVRDGQALQNELGYSTAGEAERVTGRVRGRASGEVLIMPEDGSAPLVLARADTATLMHNDRVEVRAVGINDRGRRMARLIRRIGDSPDRVGGVWHTGPGRGRVTGLRLSSPPSISSTGRASVQFRQSALRMTMAIGEPIVCEWRTPATISARSVSIFIRPPRP